MFSPIARCRTHNLKYVFFRGTHHNPCHYITQNFILANDIFQERLFKFSTVSRFSSNGFSLRLACLFSRTTCHSYEIVNSPSIFVHSTIRGVDFFTFSIVCSTLLRLSKPFSIKELMPCFLFKTSDLLRQT